MPRFYELVLNRRAARFLRRQNAETATRIVTALEQLQDDLSGDVKRLTNHEPAYRLRIGNYRVLFDIDGTTIFVEDIRHRQSGY